MRIFKSTYRDRSGRKRKTSKFYVEFKDNLGRVRRLPAFTDRRQSESFGRWVERLVAAKMNREPLSPELSKWLESIPPKTRDRFVKIGLLDGSKNAAAKPLSAHIADFGQSLADKGDTAKQVQMTVSRVERIVKGCKFQSWTDVSASKVQRFIAGLQENGLSKKTANYYLKSIKHLARWMKQDGRATSSPVEHLQCVRVTKNDLRRQRRALEPDEIRRLLQATMAAEPRFRLSGYQRAIIYRLACESGLRANEIRRLKVSDFDFDRCTVTARDRNAKNRREATLPLKPDTAGELKELFANKLPDAQALKVPGKPIDMLRPDLEAAGIEYQDEAGRVVDFHSLRHTTASLLANSGVHPKTIQSIMRHSTVALSMNVYAHVLRNGEADAIANLPDLSSPSRESQRALKTGTDNQNVTDSVLASRLALLCAEQRPTMTSGEKVTRPGAIASGVFDRARQDSNLQPSDSKSATLSN